MATLQVLKRSLTVVVDPGDGTDKSITYSGLNTESTPDAIDQTVEELSGLFVNGIKSYTVTQKSQIVE